MKRPTARQIWDDGRAVVRARWYLRHATAVGQRVRVWGHPIIANHGTLIVGDRVRLVSTVATMELAVGEGATLEIGDGVFINAGTSIGVTEHIKIGAGCSIGPHVMMMDNDFHRTEPERRNELPESAPIILEENVWIGARAMILRGVTIGAGSIVGAACVVTRDVPARSLVAGPRAQIVRQV